MKEILYSTKFLNLMASKREGRADWVYAHRPNAKNVVIIVPVIHKPDADYTLRLKKNFWKKRDMKQRVLK